eukprot:TRINITY_DN4098_c0_g2_i1.p1 TRINITY_DN4098_c0_g2~~TRINITY_DN4098_c0_g2_i1.p1  ORF type:complete len:221 (+),score=11.84 TRINITY_DN4098_c0_g2_i1:601-1263(+)
MILNLDNNQINDEGVQYICSTLKNKRNSHLIELDLSLNNVNDQGAISLFEAVAISESLQILNISCNHITKESFEAFLNMLKINTSLHSLNISGNPLINQQQTATGSGSGSASNTNSASNSKSMSISHSTTNSRPASRLSHMKGSDGSIGSSRTQTFRANNNNESKIYAKQLEHCLLNENISIINLNLLHIGLSKLEIKTINRILKPRKSEKKANRKERIS